MEHLSVTITYGQIIAICGLIASVWGVVKIIKEILKPAKELRSRVADDENRIESIETHQQATDAVNEMILTALMALVNHEINGNGIDKMKQIRDEINDFLIKK